MAKRSERLLNLLQALRRRRRPIAGQVLADEMGVSLRSVYRDIETLKSMGAAIDGEAGVGFQLRAEHFLPPLMFTDEELEALVLGLRGLIYGPDSEMALTARDASAKIEAVLPKPRRDEMQSIGLFVIPPREVDGDNPLGQIRRALRLERQLWMGYRDKSGATTERTIYPLALGYFEGHQTLAAWCTLRQDFRSFRVDGIASLEMLEARLPEPRRTLFHRWASARNLPDLT
ncbi:YafY family protein [Devosia sp. ZB163]|uniref:helix-turn-helix transcriptional regulator n=1 Tax=Devosia sp. ZB163 TaxID=3025938 RepID=UPI002360D1EB|nr:YafY family protein [Devosia sp. ZB163]MDC9826491.1 YafY family protein [Devosia sp. ZB163]